MADGAARPEKMSGKENNKIARLLEKIFAYNKHPENGLVQPQDKIAVRFALTIYPYSLGFSFSIILLP